MQIQYGRQWPDEWERWQIELKMYQHPEWCTNAIPTWKHLIKAAICLWGPENSQQQFIWHPWAVDIFKESCTNQSREPTRFQSIVGLAGPGSSGKSRAMAIWALLNWLVDPVHTLIYVTSTSIPRAQDKIWGALEAHYNALPDSAKGMGKLVNTPTPVIWTEANGVRIKTAGIKLVAMATGSSKESIGKLQGAKANAQAEHRNGRCVLILDELSDLSHAIIPAIENLKSHDWFSVQAAANPRSKYDPFSLMFEPEAGYESISVESSRWVTKTGGICLHFDDMKNPNYLAYLQWKQSTAPDKKSWSNPWPVKGAEVIVQTLEDADINSPEFWRNFRGFWCPFGSDSTIYTDEDIKAANADKQFTTVGSWRLTKPKIRIMGIDPAFSSGGDRTMAVIGELGWDSKQLVQVLNIVGIEELTMNAADKTKNPSVQIGEKIIETAKKYMVDPSNVGFDSTRPEAADNLAMVWGRNDFYRVSFGGNATKTPISDLDSTPGDEKYGNRVTELWFFGKELLRHHQLYGITDDMAMELVVRKYTTSKSGNTVRLLAETKREMKKRTGGKSPDEADALAIMIDVARQKHGLRTPVTKLANDPQHNGKTSPWMEMVKARASARSSHRLSTNRT